MVWRTVFITRVQWIADAAKIADHPNVRKLWWIPSQHVLFEFYDPIFELVFGLDAEKGRAIPEDVRSKVVSLMERQRSLLAPLYQGRPQTWHGIRMGLPLGTVFYRYVDRDKISFPWFGCFANWETARSIKLCGKLDSRNPDQAKHLERVLDQWSLWAKSVGEIVHVREFKWHERDFSAQCNFDNACGDACMALYTMLLETKDQTSLKAAGFFVPGEMSPDFSEIGGTGTI